MMKYTDRIFSYNWLKFKLLYIFKLKSLHNHQINFYLNLSSTVQIVLNSIIGRIKRKGNHDIFISKCGNKKVGKIVDYPSSELSILEAPCIHLDTPEDTPFRLLEYGGHK